MRNFWQKHPSGMEAHGLTEDEARLIAWFWSPEAPAMDIRHYDTLTHVESSYEGAEEARATPYGVGNTSELTIWCRTFTPSPVELEAYASYNGSPPRLVCEPAYCGARALWHLELAGPGNARQSPPRREAGRDHRLLPKGGGAETLVRLLGLRRFHAQLRPCAPCLEL